MHIAQSFFQYKIISLALFLCALLLSMTALLAGQKYMIASCIGLIAGVSLYHASFGFTAAWRNILTNGKGAGLRMQFLLILIVSIISYPLIAYGDDIGFSVNAAVAPMGIALIIGAFLFGFGMMFGGGCGSGTLFTAGGGSVRMMIVLASFIGGSLLGTYHLPWWQQLPKVRSFSLVETFGAWGGLLSLISLLGLITIFSIRLEKKRYGALEKYRSTESFISGPWSPFLGAMGLAIVSIACLLILARPWGITSAFALWGAKIVMLGGVDVMSWPYWNNRSALLERSILQDSTSVMNFGIIIGAMLASALAGKYAPTWRISRIEILTAIIGGLLMGYGARLAYGCNIGAYLGGIISGSAHGWLWMLSAFLGSYAAIKSKKYMCL